MGRRFSTPLSTLFLIAVLSLAAAPLRSSGQPAQDEQKETKKARKIWTNDDFPSNPAAQKEEAKASEESAPAADPFAELDRAREERKLAQEDLQAFHKDREELRNRRSRASESVEMDMLDLAIETAETKIVKLEEQLKELDDRIAELEKQTRGRKRPAPKPATQPSG